MSGYKHNPIRRLFMTHIRSLLETEISQCEVEGQTACQDSLLLFQHGMVLEAEKL
jgi:hypothetical protein